MTVTVRFFAGIREAIGHGSEACATSAHDVAALRDELIARGAPYAQALARGKSVRIAVDQTMGDEATALRAGVEVAFFPPVTGG
ncbi:MAG: MoaD/ThiS family protein [Burkholderiaceae bacterium]